MTYQSKETLPDTAMSGSVNPASLSTLGMSSQYTAERGRRKRILARGPTGEFSVAGKDAMALEALIEAGKSGVTALELCNTWALRLGAYVHDLRKLGLDIETIREPHDDIGGWHGRYVLHSEVAILGEIK
jgi:Winged helix domain